MADEKRDLRCGSRAFGTAREREPEHAKQRDRKPAEETFGHCTAAAQRHRLPCRLAVERPHLGQHVVELLPVELVSPNTGIWVRDAMLQMTKIDIAGLQRACDGP